MVNEILVNEIKQFVRVTNRIRKLSEEINVLYIRQQILLVKINKNLKKQQ